MQDFRKRRTKKAEILRIARGTAGVIVLAVITYFAARAAYGMYGKFVAASQARTAAQAQLASLQSQYNTMSTQVNELQTPQGIEAQMRERYGVAEPGEGEIDIVAQTSTATSTATQSEPWWEVVWHAINIFEFHTSFTKQRLGVSRRIRLYESGLIDALD